MLSQKYRLINIYFRGNFNCKIELKNRMIDLIGLLPEEDKEKVVDEMLSMAWKLEEENKIGGLNGIITKS